MVRKFEDIQKDLAYNLKHARALAGLSQEALALAADVDRTYVSQIERGIGNPSLFVLLKLCAVLNLDLSHLILEKMP